MRGQVVVITGGSSGIGLAAAEEFARREARVVIIARTEQRLREAAASLPGHARGIAADVVSHRSIVSALADVERTEGRIDVLINSAGRFALGPAEEAGPELAAELIETNYLGAIRTIHAALPLLRAGRRRSIVTLSSIAGKLAPPFMAAYAGSKFALHGYLHSLRQELAPEGFHVGIVIPGPVDTPMIQGKVRTAYYPLPIGVPVIPPRAAAREVVRCVRRRSAEVVVPRRLSVTGRLGAAFPRMVDRVYRLYRPRD